LDSSLFKEQNDLLYAVPGGLIGVGLKVDPTLTRGDRLVGHVKNQFKICCFIGFENF